MGWASPKGNNFVLRHLTHLEDKPSGRLPGRNPGSAPPPMHNTSQFNKTGGRKHLTLNQGISFGLSTYQEPQALPEQNSALEGEVKGW